MQGNAKCLTDPINEFIGQFGVGVASYAVSPKQMSHQAMDFTCLTSFSKAGLSSTAI